MLVALIRLKIFIHDYSDIIGARSSGMGLSLFLVIDFNE